MGHAGREALTSARGVRMTGCPGGGEGPEQPSHRNPWRRGQTDVGGRHEGAPISFRPRRTGASRTGQTEHRSRTEIGTLSGRRGRRLLIVAVRRCFRWLAGGVARPVEGRQPGARGRESLTPERLVRTPGLTAAGVTGAVKARRRSQSGRCQANVGGGVRAARLLAGPTSHVGEASPASKRAALTPPGDQAVSANPNSEAVWFGRVSHRRGRPRVASCAVDATRPSGPWPSDSRAASSPLLDGRGLVA